MGKIIAAWPFLEYPSKKIKTLRLIYTYTVYTNFIFGRETPRNEETEILGRG